MKTIKFDIASHTHGVLVQVLAGLARVSIGRCDMAPTPGRPDMVMADFQETNLGEWMVTGQAFGNGSAPNALLNQMPADGFLGGGFSKKTCINLMCAGNVMRTATGGNTQPSNSEQPLKPGEKPLAEVRSDLLEVTAEINLGDAMEVVFKLREIPVAYAVQKAELTSGNRRTTLKPVAGKIELQIFVDRTAVDIFGNYGELYMPMGILVPPETQLLEISAKGGTAQIESLTVYTLQSAWK